MSLGEVGRPDMPLSKAEIDPRLLRIHPELAKY
jgi:hypothetical protein